MPQSPRQNHPADGYVLRICRLIRAVQQSQRGVLGVGAQAAILCIAWSLPMISNVCPHPPQPADPPQSGRCAGNSPLPRPGRDCGPVHPSANAQKRRNDRAGRSPRTWLGLFQAIVGNIRVAQLCVPARPVKLALSAVPARIASAVSSACPPTVAAYGTALSSRLPRSTASK